MKPLFKCELNYYPSRHLNHIYDGFDKLRNNGIIDLTVKPVTAETTRPLLRVLVNNKYNVIYDTLDGLNWIDDSIESNLNYFKKNIIADFYFKRSFNKQFVEHSPENCKVFPLGLYYSFKPEGSYHTNLQQKIKDFLKDNTILSRYTVKTSFKSRDFEFYPIPSKENRILFLTQLWNPDDVSLEHLKIEREVINRNRIDCINTLKKEFPNNFIGGLQHDNFSMRHSKGLIMPLSITKRETFLKTIKESNICIATSGLHNSIGGKFGEYVAASRGILSEPLKYELPGNFEPNKNYFEFKDNNELINNIRELLNGRDRLSEMMYSNFQYYNNYLRSDVLVLNTLLKVSQSQ